MRERKNRKKQREREKKESDREWTAQLRIKTDGPVDSGTVGTTTELAQLLFGSRVKHTHKGTLLTATKEEMEKNENDCKQNAKLKPSQRWWQDECR